ncbi:MAG: MATE family efflux transporter [Clostridia bacterium]|nr:MATE family efflux transporter [Clostridia bacterium]
MSRIQLSDHFGFSRLFRFTFPSIVMMIFTSIYGIVDGFFVSNFAGEAAFVAVNFIIPYPLILGAVGFMFGTGGSALIARTLGEGEKKKANRIFSLIVYTSAISGVIIMVAGLLLLRPVAIFLGASGDLLTDSLRYGNIILLAIPAYILQFAFQSLFITAEKPRLALAVTVAAGVANMILDALLVGALSLGIEGAAIATAISQYIGGVVPVIYFLCPNSSLLRLTGTGPDIRSLIRVCVNGSSELMSNISMPAVSMIYNAQLLLYSGEKGVAAYGVLMYVCMIFIAIFIGYTVGIAPVISFHYGAGNKKELKSLLSKSAIIIGAFSVLMFIAGELLGTPFSMLFVGYDTELLEMTSHAFFIFSFSFLFTGYAIFFSGFFTALNDGVTSAIISFMRTLVFQVAAVLILPLIFKLDGIWISLIVAELMAVVVSLIFLFVKKKKYGYM